MPMQVEGFKRKSDNAMIPLRQLSYEHLIKHGGHTHANGSTQLHHGKKLRDVVANAASFRTMSNVHVPKNKVEEILVRRFGEERTQGILNNIGEKNMVAVDLDALPK